tara:strand:- start:26 stop:424 length:399 start_codon:yes stop_codon:yes gene_type:complete
MKRSHLFTAAAIIASGLMLAGCAGAEPVIVDPTQTTQPAPAPEETVDPELDPINDSTVLTMQTEVDITADMIRNEVEFGTETQMIKDLVVPANSQPDVAEITITFNDDNTFTVTGVMLNREDVEPYIVTGDL